MAQPEETVLYRLVFLEEDFHVNVVLVDVDAVSTEKESHADQKEPENLEKEESLEDQESLEESVAKMDTLEDYRLALEPVRMSNPDWDRISKLIRKTYGQNSCIVRIEEVHADTSGYEMRLKEMEIDHVDPEERDSDYPVQEMYHGTKEGNVTSILRHGLMASKNVTSAYGKGTYFSPDIRTSLLGYTDVSKSTKLSYVFLCDIILPDTGGNKTNIYVCPRDDSFRIKYLVRFFKNAP